MFIDEPPRRLEELASLVGFSVKFWTSGLDSSVVMASILSLATSSKRKSMSSPTNSGQKIQNALNA